MIMRESGKVFRNGRNALEIEVEWEVPRKRGTIVFSSQSDINRIQVGESCTLGIVGGMGQYEITIDTIGRSNRGTTATFSVKP
jgi:hypothetical protein